jgi:hypothetical protein
VPIYRGAPNIADYAIGPHSFIHVDESMTPAKLGALLLYLDKNDTAYEEYHAWRNAPAETIKNESPLGRLIAKSQQEPLCSLCAAVHARKELNASKS